MIYYFYKIVCDDLPNFVYVGSTKAFANRKYEHKRSCNNEKRSNYNFKIYQTIRENGGWDNWRMVCVHQQEVANKRQAEQIEEQYRVELNGNMNAYRAFLSPEQRKECRKEWYENNPDYNKEYYETNKGYYKEYRETNKEKISEYKKEKIKCECGCEITRDSLAKHKRTKKHIKLMQNI
jgi:hypothetical protein